MRTNGRRQINFGAARVALALVAAVNVGGAQSTAPDIIVNTTADVVDFAGSRQVPDLPGPDALVSLREAVIAANTTPGPQVIAFNIPISDPGFDGAVFTIEPELGFNLWDDGTTIDGATQTAFTGDTNAWGPEIVLDGSEVIEDSAGFGLYNSSHNTIRSLVVHSFVGGAGIQFVIGEGGSPDDNRVVGCFIGTNATGESALGNSWEGIAVHGNRNVIGGPNPADRNVIAGNNPDLPFCEVAIGDPNPAIPPGAGNIVEGNFIGTDRTGTVSLSTSHGVCVGNGPNTVIRGNLISGTGSESIGITLTRGNGSVVQGNRIGTDMSGRLPLPNGQGVVVFTADTLIEGNVIAFNHGNGIAAVSGPAGSASVTISLNAIFSNGALGIDLQETDADGNGVSGVTANNPGDSDTGPNDLLNYPVLESARATPGRLVVKGYLDTPDSNSVTIEVFATGPEAVPTGHGQGAVFLGSLKPNPNGVFAAPVAPVPRGTLITATATDAAGNTSEFAANIVARSR